LEAQSLKPREWVGDEAKKAYEKGEFEQALHTFSRAEEKWSQDFRLAVGKGASHYRLRQFEEAKAAFFESAQKTESPELKAQALYNAGNSMVQLGQYKEAIKTYEDSIKLNPNDKEARDNLEYVKRLLEQQKQNENKDNQSEKKDSSQQQQQEDNSSSSDEKQSQDRQDEASEQSEDDKVQASPSPTPTEDKQNEQESSQSEQKQDSKDQAGEKQQESPSQKEGRSSKDRLSESAGAELLESVEEDRSALYRYRRERASSNEQTPEHDW